MYHSACLWSVDSSIMSRAGIVIPTRIRLQGPSGSVSTASTGSPLSAGTKECRALGTRYEKLAVDSVALWMVATIEKLLWLDPKKASG